MSTLLSPDYIEQNNCCGIARTVAQYDNPATRVRWARRWSEETIARCSSPTMQALRQEAVRRFGLFVARFQITRQLDNQCPHVLLRKHHTYGERYNPLCLYGGSRGHWVDHVHRWRTADGGQLITMQPYCLPAGGCSCVSGATATYPPLGIAVVELPELSWYYPDSSTLLVLRKAGGV